MRSGGIFLGKIRSSFIQAPWHSLSLLILVASTVGVIFTFRNYGVTWDEYFHVRYGAQAWNFYTSFFTDRMVFSLSNLPLYGAFFDLVVRSFHWATPFVGEFELRHLLTAFSGILGLVGVWKLGQCCCKDRPTAQRVGCFSILFLEMTPMYSGHLFNNGKDIPFAAAFTWSLYYIVVYLRSLPNPSKRIMYSTAAVLGVTCAIRIGGVLLFAYLWLFLLLVYRKDKNKRNLASGLMLSVWAYLLMTLFWPLAIIKPIIGPLEALFQMQNFDSTGENLYWGKNWSHHDLPWHYIPGHFLVQLPEVLIVFFFLGLAFSVFNRAPSRANRLLILSVVFPVIYSIVKKSVVYDAVRHFLFLLPSIAVLAALGLDTLTKKIKEKAGRVGELALGSAVLALFAITIIQTLSLYPYQYIYYNQLVGGVHGAYGRFEMDYWAHSFREAAMRLQTYEREHASIRINPVRVAVNGPIVPLFYYLPSHYRFEPDPENADYKVVLGRYTYFQENQQGEKIIEISRDGVPLTRVYKLREAFQRNPL